MTRVLLTIDIGNTATKLSVFEGETLRQSVAGVGLGPEAVDALLDTNTVDGIACCCVGDDSNRILTHVSVLGLPSLFLDGMTSLPIRVDYATPSTLGADRIAAAVGAVEPGGSVLVADAGTALTTDVVSRGVFVGGNISPGLKLRFESLHRFTSRLPLVDRDRQIRPFGHDTESAIRSGVVGGLVAELEADYREALKIDDEIRMVLTGGDADFLHSLLTVRGVPAVICHQAVGLGLVRIFEYNLTYEKN